MTEVKDQKKQIGLNHYKLPDGTIDYDGMFVTALVDDDGTANNQLLVI